MRPPASSHLAVPRRRADPPGQRRLMLAAVLLLVLTSSLVATIRPVRAAAPFVDVSPNDPAKVAIDALYDRGIIKGYQTDPPTFGPGDLSLRAQMAALIGRAMGWDTGGANPFTDQCDATGCIDDELWGYVAALASRDVAKGYDPTTFGPFDNVLKQQVILFIARAKVAKGDWVKQPFNASLYPGSASSESDYRDIATYVYYAGAPPDAPTTLGPAWDTYASEATRGWFARALWQTYPEGKGTPVPGQTPSPSPSPSASPSVEPGPDWQRPAADASWLTVLNAYRALAGLPPVTENPSQSDGCAKHSKYIVKTGELDHFETEGNLHYTPEGHTAAQKSNLGAGSGQLPSQRETIEQFVGSVFHALGTFDPRLGSSGYGEYFQADSIPPNFFNYAFCLNVLSGRTGSLPAEQYPVRFPMVNGVQPFLTALVSGEIPDPLVPCPGYTNPVGGVVLLQMDTAVASASGTLTTQGGTPLDSCVHSEIGNLMSFNAVVLIPRQPLVAATTYTVSLVVNGTPYTWSFTTAAAGQAIP